MKIPFIDLHAQHMSIKSEIDEALRSCIEGSSFIRGEAVFEFERSFAEYLGVPYCIGCGNGTDALEIILRSLNIGRGDEVIVPALSWVATAAAVNNVGAEPVFVDVSPLNFTIDHNKIGEKITKRTKAIIPVHLYGCPADMDEILSIALKNGLHVVEDCAQAHGAEYKGKKTGTFGVASAFSFFPSKNLGALGDGGAIVTNNKELSELSRKISNHGQLHEKHKHFIVGRNSRLDNIQASVLGVKLKYLDEWNRKRREAASFYISKLGGREDLILPIAEENKKHVYHLFVIRSSNRSRLIELFDRNGISWAIHYPEPLPFLDCYNYKKHGKDDFSIALQITRNIISLPLYPEIPQEDLNLICDKIQGI